MPNRDIVSDTEYAVKVVVKNGDVAVYLDNEPRLAATDPNHQPSGKVGFYVSGFDYMLFDDIRFSVVP